MYVLSTTTYGRAGMNGRLTDQYVFVHVEVEFVKFGKLEAQSVVWAGSYEQGSRTGP